MLSREHCGRFSLDASVCIPDTDRAGLERLLGYCARPPFALAHLHPLDTEHLVYHNPKPRSDSPRNLVLIPLELIDKIAALIPPPRAHLRNPAAGVPELSRPDAHHRLHHRCRHCAQNSGSPR